MRKEVNLQETNIEVDQSHRYQNTWLHPLATELRDVYMADSQ